MMLQWIYNILAGLSLILAFPLIMGWVRSDYTGDQILYSAPPAGPVAQKIYNLYSAKGVLLLAEYRIILLSPPSQDAIAYARDAYFLAPSGLHWTSTETPPAVPHFLSTTWYKRGFFWDNITINKTWRGGIRYQAKTKNLGLPYWLPVLLALALPTHWVVRQWRWKRRQRTCARMGLCLNCGYDLRATPGRCPECGAPVAPASHFRNGKMT